MKKTVCIVVAMLVLLACAATGFAAGEETFEIPELSMTVTIPGAGEMLTCVTDGAYNEAMIASIEEQGLTEDDYNQYARQNAISFTAIDAGGSYEYSIVSAENSDTKYVYDLDTLSDAELQEMLKAASGVKGTEDMDQEVLKEMEANGANLNDISNVEVNSIETLNGHAYLASSMDGAANGDNIWITMYSTIKNGKYIYIRLVNYDIPPTEEQKAELRTVAQSAEYEKVPSVGKTYASDKTQNASSGVGGAALRGAIIGGTGALIAGLIGWSASKRKKKRMAEQAGPYDGGVTQNNVQRDGYQSVAPPQAMQQPPVQQPQAEPQSAEELVKRLEELKEKGTLTEAEFEQKKREIENRNGGSGNA